jgi:hypothetical protein
MLTIKLHLERLARHYTVAVQTYDQVTLLDLSHALRIWSEMNISLGKDVPAFVTTRAFKTSKPPKKIAKMAANYAHVVAYMPGSVMTMASAGNVFSAPEMAEGAGDFVIQLSIMNDGKAIHLKDICFIAGRGDADGTYPGAGITTPVNYQQWMGSEAVRFGYRNADGKMEKVALSREMLIKRVANILDGSHPSSAAAPGDYNKFDGPVRRLMTYTVGGLPLPYFVLMKIAQDILDIAPKLLGLPPFNLATVTRPTDA